MGSFLPGSCSFSRARMRLVENDGDSVSVAGCVGNNGLGYYFSMLEQGLLAKLTWSRLTWLSSGFLELGFIVFRF